MSATLSHSGLPDGVSRFDLLNLFEVAAKPTFGLSRTAIALIRHYIQRTADQDYARGQICAVWAQVCRTAQAVNLSSRSINSAERELQEAGFIARTSRSKGARSGAREDGRITWAFGINLAPLIERYHELRA
ncbi:MAG: hypothetical protein KGQ42_08115 [Alphaproteobacteria bacterium]|nr:hypothetical protein [Alphaproteobacteria bacterium]MDE2041520.1 hypothetical protein [Alphaproteobacteria bacterium]MDE2340037.1 hypothetical protein [Alphaproteobacteria bacterium]